MIELMIVVAIIGILATTAVPSFLKYINKAKLVEGYVIIDATTKALITQHIQSDDPSVGFASSMVSITHLNDYEADFLNGAKAPLNITLANGAPIIPEANQINFIFNLISNDVNTKIASSITMSGSSCNKSPDYIGITGVTLGLPEDYQADVGNDYFTIIAGYSNFAVNSSRNCVFLIKMIQTSSPGQYNTSSILQLN